MNEPREIIEVSSRVCCACKVDKPAAEFDRDRGDRNGLQWRCKECRKVRNKSYRLAHPEYFARKRDEYQSREGYWADLYAKNRERYKFHRAKYGSTLIGRCNALLDSAKRRAAKKGLEFTISLEWLVALWEYQGGRCELTGIELDLVTRNQKHRSYVPFSPSLDRCDTSRGYTPDNTRLVCTAMNLALNQFGEEVFAKLCSAYMTINQEKGDSDGS
jgi:hypothetical protein